jgi:hypothetical protein
MKTQFIKSQIKTIGKENTQTVMFKKENEEIVLAVLKELDIQPVLFVNEKYACMVSTKKYYNEHITFEEYEEIMEMEYAQQIADTMAMFEEEEQDELARFQTSFLVNKTGEFEYELF